MKISLDRKFIVFLFTIGAIFPQLIALQSDLILIVLAFLFLRDKQLINNILLIFFFILLKYMFTQDLLIVKYNLPIVRPLIILGVIKTYSALKQDSYDLKRLMFFTKFIIVFSTVFNIIGCVDLESYMVINNFWNAGRAGVMFSQPSTVSSGMYTAGVSVASIAAHQMMRFSSFLYTPVVAGAYFLSLLFAVILFKAQFRKLSFYFWIVTVLVNGSLPLSSFWEVGLIIMPIIYCSLSLFNQSLKDFLFKLGMFAPTIITFSIIIINLDHNLTIFGNDVFGGRFGPESYLMKTIHAISLSDYLFGVNKLLGSGLRIGDSGILMRSVTMGLPFSLLYTFFLTQQFYSIATKQISLKFHNSFYAYIICFALGEMGFTAFSQPTYIFIQYIPLLILIIQSEQYLAKEKKIATH